MNIFRRKRLGLTDYRKRLDLLKSRKIRLVIRRSNKNITMQLAEYNVTGDKVLATAHSNHLKKYGWNFSGNNLPACYLTGYLLGNKSKDKVKEVILDIGLQKSIKGSRIYSALKGFVDSGVKVNFGEDIFPKEDRIMGKHILDYTKKDVPKNFQEVKSKIGVKK